MIATKPAPSHAPSATGIADAPQNLNARLAAAAAALRHTREQVMTALDGHLEELDKLRRALGSLDAPLLPSVASPSSHAPAARAPEFKTFDHAPIERAPKPAAVRLPELPMLTQVIWPSKEGPPESTPMHVVSPPLPRPAIPPRPVSSPLVAYPAAAQSVADGDMALSHRHMEQATLEELNAALAYAFSHVSNGRTPGEQGSDGTHFMAAPAAAQPWPGQGK